MRATNPAWGGVRGRHYPRGWIALRTWNVGVAQIDPIVQLPCIGCYEYQPFGNIPAFHFENFIDCRRVIREAAKTKHTFGRIGDDASRVQQARCPPNYL